MHNKLNGAQHNKLERAQFGLNETDPFYQKQCYLKVKLSNSTVLILFLYLY
jgi:hypothetical protein